MNRRAGVVVAGALALALSLSLAGCGRLNPYAGRATVVAAFYPLAYVAQRIVGRHATVLDLTHPGIDPHDLELTVRQTAEVADAEVAFYETGLQPAVDQAVAQTSPAHTVDAADSARLVDAPGGDELDPHFWLDPTRLADVASAFEQTMSVADPRHAADFARNLAALRKDLSSLDGRIRHGLAHCATRTIVVSHDAFGYFGRRYHLRVVAINGLSPDAEPSPEHVAQLTRLVHTDAVTTVFSEELGSSKMADVLAHETGVHSAVLDPIEGLGPATADQDYLSLMRRDLAAIEEANQCT
ncbi:MAG TPA: metal ABC transporter substrate-binding protein [Nocardioidaceae bacterium]|nr:metal ABC transporter substrate-binding protein [Nocardioidaceae bacterium]